MNTNQGQERIDTGEDVIGSDGAKLGSVAYVVVHPPRMNVTDLVVSTGAILGRDIVVPIDAVQSIANGKVQLSMDKGQLNSCPDFVDVKYAAPPASWVPPASSYFPRSAVRWPSAYYPELQSAVVNAPSGTVGIHQGMDVESSDRHKVGTIDGFDVNPHDDVTAIIVKHGFIFSKDTRIPVVFLSGIKDGKVNLNLTKDEVQVRFEGKDDGDGGLNWPDSQ